MLLRVTPILGEMQMFPPSSITDQFFTQGDFDETVQVIHRHIHCSPRIGLVLGSGLGSLAERVREADVIPYGVLPHFPQPAVEGHAGRLIVGKLGTQEILVMQGRAHYYEGYSLQQVTFPIRVMQRLGIGTLIVTNAAGGLHPDFEAGDIMLITDQLNLVAMTSLSPLRGPYQPELGPRFPSMMGAYDIKLRQLAHAEARVLGLSLREGVYCMLAGPHFETPADIRFLRSIGVDAVGMSTVPEVLVARHGGMRVLGLSVISNIDQADEVSTFEEDSHAEVLAVTSRVSGLLCDLIDGILIKL